MRNNLHHFLTCHWFTLVTICFVLFFHKSSTRNRPPTDVCQIPIQTLNIRNKFLHLLDRMQISVNASHRLPSMAHDGINLFTGHFSFLKILIQQIPVGCLRWTEQQLACSYMQIQSKHSLPPSTWYAVGAAPHRNLEEIWSWWDCATAKCDTRRIIKRASQLFQLTKPLSIQHTFYLHYVCIRDTLVLTKEGTICLTWHFLSRSSLRQGWTVLRRSTGRRSQGRPFCKRYGCWTIWTSSWPQAGSANRRPSTKAARSAAKSPKNINRAALVSLQLMKYWTNFDVKETSRETPGFWLPTSIDSTDSGSLKSRELKKKRSHYNKIKIARTISDLAGCEQIQLEHIAEAIQYRSLNRQWCG